MQTNISTLHIRWLAVLWVLCIVLTGLAWTCNSGLAREIRPPGGYLVIDHLVGPLGPVSFDHGLHDRYANCIECHHHTAGEPPSDRACLPCHRSPTAMEAIGCKECHHIDSFSRAHLEEQETDSVYHIDKPGLLGAYHLNCISCHEVIGTGPTDCRGCHDAKI